MSRSMNPKGGDDRVYTPPPLAQQIVRHFDPGGSCLEPCAGEDAFIHAMCLAPLAFIVYECEIDRGEDFFDFNLKVDWIITNPPWSQFRQFLKHSMELADNVVFLANLNAWVTRSRMRDVFDAGFGYKEALLVDTPPKPWPQTGFQLAAVHIQRGYTGGMNFIRLTP